MTTAAYNIGLFVTCPVDLMRPEVGFASVTLLEQAGCQVSVPPQSCCGQIAYNNGATKDARDIAWSVVKRFEHFDYVVAPSGSCAGMMQHHYPKLFKDDPRKPAIDSFCGKVFEITTFLHDVLSWTPPQANIDLSDRRVTYHDSCAGLRELNIKQQPRALLKRCANVDVSEMPDTDVCCGFGGSFCIKFPDIACRMADDKLDRARSTQADYLVGGDVSCLLHLASRYQRQRDSEANSVPLEIRHVTELLAGTLDSAAIAEGDTDEG